jgi:PAS domain S-box-containing protein
VVDDERNLRDGSERILAREGHEVRCSEKGEEALAMMEAHPADIVLLDLRMPGLDGLEVLQRIRRNYPDTLVIIVTGFATIQTAIEAMKLGAYDFMTKPFRPDQLRLLVGRAMEHILLREERDRLTEERDRGLWAITTEKSRLRTVVDSINPGLIITDPDQRIVMCNKSFYGMMGLAPESIIGSLISDQPLLATLNEIIQAALAGVGDDKGAMVREFIIDRERPLYIQTTVSRVATGAGKLLGLVTLLRDVTAAREQEREKSAYVAMLTHELRSPLAAVDTQFHVVLKGLAGELTEKQRDMLGRMKERVGNVLEMINNLLELSKIESHQFTKDKSPTDLNSVVREVVELMMGQAQAKDLTLSAELGEKVPPVLADPQNMREVAVNLISNAIRYTLPGGQVQVATRTSGEWVCLVVSDTGLGIGSEYRDKVFERFFRIKDERARGVVGTGLGLPIVKAIVDNHHGVVELDSEPGRGSVFTVRLPALKEQDPQDVSRWGAVR